MLRSIHPVLRVRFSDWMTEQNGFLSICSDVEPYENRIKTDDFADFIEDAIFACGFHSVEEACESLMGPNLFRIWLKVMRAVAANTRLKERTDDKLNMPAVQKNPSRRRRAGYC
jgi:hypothetical protein